MALRGLWCRAHGSREVFGKPAARLSRYLPMLCSPSDLTPDGTSISLNWQGGSRWGPFSDAEITDLVVFDRHLTDVEVQQASALLGSVPAQPRVCCWDGHEAIQVVSDV